MTVKVVVGVVLAAVAVAGDAELIIAARCGHKQKQPQFAR